MIQNTVVLKSFSKTIIKRYIFSAVALIALIVIRQIILSNQIEHETNLTKVVSMVGTQRMLSERVAKNAYALYLSQNEQETIFYLHELKVSTAEWEKTNTNVKVGDINDDKLDESYRVVIESVANVDGSYQAMIAAAKDIVKMVETENYNKDTILNRVTIIQNNQGLFMEGMESIILKYNKVYSVIISNLARSELLLFFIIMLMIIFETLFIFVPTQKKLIEAFERMEESNENMMKLFRTSHGAMILIDEETTQIILMNKQAERLFSVDNTENQTIIFCDIVQCGSENGCNLMDEIKEKDRNENIDVTFSVKGNKRISALLSSSKMNFNKRPTILIGIFDITIQKRAEAILKNQVNTDELTGLYNRHYLDEIIEDEMEIADHSRTPISMAILDLDFFKKVNDKWGHPIGDEILIQTAEIMNKIIRKTDTLIRLGGEEFIVLMPQTGIDGALIVAEKIRQELYMNVHPVAGKVTASFGVAEKEKAEVFSSWYKRVDEAMYRAKEDGRNRVISYENQEKPPITSVHLDWRSEWESGDIDIDEQHKELITIANNLIYLSFQKASSEIVINQLDLLMQHIIVHFEFEEQILLQMGYPEYIRHSAIHKNLVVKGFQLKESYQNKELKAAALFSFIIDEIIIDHLINEDVQFFPYLINSKN